MIYFFLFALGTIVGSFLNVVGLRWDRKNSRPTGRFRSFGRVGGRSECPHCKKVLRWWELVPIFSFFILRARCSECKATISWQYPVVELWTGLIFASVYYVVGPADILAALYFLLLVTVFSIYVVITIYDFKYKIIPDELVYSAIFLSLLVPLALVNYSLLDWLAGLILFFFFASIWFLSRGRAMGFGDAKLGLSVGLLLGAAEGFSAIIMAFWIGAFISLTLLLFVKIGFIKDTKKLTMKSEVPFAPAIILGTWISFLFHTNILNVPLL